MSQNPLRIASLNLNKGGHTEDRLARLSDWLVAWAPSFLFLQEPWSHDRNDPARIPHFHFLGGNSNVACYATETEGRHRSVEGVDLFDDRALELLLDDTRLSNVYLPATTSSERRRFLLRLLDLLRPRRAADRAILGDFNLAPRPEDGRYGEGESAWTSTAERKALESLLTEFDLVDLLPQKGAEESPFTFERKNKGQLTRFRCDLALTSRRLAERAETLLQFDHRSRVGSSRFTDHSALILDLPIALRTRASMIYTHNTAINRGNGSRPLRMLHEAGLLAAGASVLDFGCGRGGDVKWLLEHGFAAEGYDPYPKFGHTDLPSGQYDSVLLLFVVNILPTLEERKAAVARAWQFVKPGGFLYVAARSKREIVSQARDKAWPEHGDGYLTSQSKRTFQKGHDGEDIQALLLDLPEVEIEAPPFAEKEAFSCLIARKREHVQERPAIAPVATPRRAIRLIKTTKELRALVDELLRCDVVGLDVETTIPDRRLCFVQIGTWRYTALVDALAVDDLSPLAELMESRKVLKVIHNATFERSVLAKQGMKIDPVFDTLSVSRELRGRKLPGGHGLGAVCLRELGITIDKDCQSSDWTTRPLTTRQLDYAALDAEVLLDLYARFSLELQDQARLFGRVE